MRSVFRRFKTIARLADRSLGRKTNGPTSLSWTRPTQLETRGHLLRKLSSLRNGDRVLEGRADACLFRLQERDPQPTNGPGMREMVQVGRRMSWWKNIFAMRTLSRISVKSQKEEFASLFRLYEACKARRQLRAGSTAAAKLNSVRVLRRWCSDL